MELNQTKPRRRVSQGLLLVGMQGGERLSRTPTEADLTVAKRSYAEEAHFNKEFVEVDSGRFGTQKRKGSENLGRTPVMIGRFARNKSGCREEFRIARAPQGEWGQKRRKKSLPPSLPNWRRRSPKRIYPTHPILEVRNPIAWLSGEKLCNERIQAIGIFFRWPAL